MHYVLYMYYIMYTYYITLNWTICIYITYNGCTCTLYMDIFIICTRTYTLDVYRGIHIHVHTCMCEYTCIHFVEHHQRRVRIFTYP